MPTLIEPRDFANALTALSRVIPKDDSRPVLNSILLRSCDRGILLAAANPYALVEIWLAKESGLEERRALIDEVAQKMLLAALKEWVRTRGGQVMAALTADSLAVELGDLVLPLPNGENFPDYEKVLAESRAREVGLPEGQIALNPSLVAQLDKVHLLAPVLLWTFRGPLGAVSIEDAASDWPRVRALLMPLRLPGSLVAPKAEATPAAKETAA